MYLLAMTFGILILPSILVNLLQEKPFSKPTFKVSWWVGIAAFLQFGISVIYSFNYNQYMNFVMHAVGGGIACSLMSQHVKKELGWKFSWLHELFFLFAFVSAFGVANELAEFFLDTVGFGRFSINRIDTWLDMLANSSGALLGHLAILSLRKSKIIPKSFGKSRSSR
jgi:hypothetical protein